MYKIKKINFKSIIKSGDDTSTVEFEGNGTIRETEDSLAYYLDYGKEHYEFIFEGEGLTLRQNRSTLHLLLGKKIDNEYHTAYGTMLLTACLEKKEIKDNGFRLIYDLYQGTEKISRVYMIIITA